MKKNFDRIKECYNSESVSRIKFIGQKKKINRHLREIEKREHIKCHVKTFSA
jgi:hypothetical protein